MDKLKKSLNEALNWCIQQRISIPAEMRFALKAQGVGVVSRMTREKLLQNSLNAIFEKYAPILVQAAMDGVITTDELMGFEMAVRRESFLTLVEAGMDRLPEIAAEFGIPADSPAALDAIETWAEQRAASIAHDVGMTTSKRLLSLRRTTINGELYFEQSTMDRIVNWALGEGRAETIAATEVTRARTYILDIYQSQLTKLGVVTTFRWQTEEDEKVCPICSPLDKRTQDKWPSQYKDGPPAHVNCRCEKTLETLNPFPAKV